MAEQSRSPRRPRVRAPRRLAAMVVAGLMVTAVASGCSSSGSDGGTTITVAHGYTDAEAKAITSLADQWNTAHPDAKVDEIRDGFHVS